MEHKRTAATLTGRNDDLTSFCGQHASGREIYVREENLLNTADEKADSPASLTRGCEMLGNRRGLRNGRNQTFEGSHTPRQKFGAASHNRLQTRALIEPHGT